MATVNVNIDDSLREDLLCTALEGGSNYWYLIKRDAKAILDKYKDDIPFSTMMWKAIKDGESIPIYDLENDGEKLGDISLESMTKGEQIMADKYPNHFRNLLGDSNWDAETADVWFQLSVIGEIAFG